MLPTSWLALTLNLNYVATVAGMLDTSGTSKNKDNVLGTTNRMAKTDL
jgi:hypothetical protein